jgi:hypothetical protein
MWTRFENNERLGHTARSLDVARSDPGIARRRAAMQRKESN